jgi:hypothetical protein
MGVEFNENKPLNYGAYQQKSSGGGLTQMLIKWGLAKDTKGANIVMIIVTIICTVLAIYIAI